MEVLPSHSFHFDKSNDSGFLSDYIDLSPRPTEIMLNYFVPLPNQVFGSYLFSNAPNLRTTCVL